MDMLFTEALKARGALYFDVVDSTNQVAKQLARQGARHNTLILAEEQTLGRGRRGRGWVSRPGMGTWMTLIVRPDVSGERAPELVMLAAVAVCQAIQGLSGADARIKWPNDIVCKGKKLCGMLAEMEASEKGLSWAVIGVGINVLQEEFPKDLPDAGSIQSVSGKVLCRADVVEAFWDAFDRAYALWIEDGMAWLLPVYKALSATLGEPVRAVLQDETIEGVVQDIAEDGALLLWDSDGALRRLYAGDVSIRGMGGYVPGRM